MKPTVEYLPLKYVPRRQRRPKAADAHKRASAEGPPTGEAGRGRSASGAKGLGTGFIARLAAGVMRWLIRAIARYLAAVPVKGPHANREGTHKGL